MGLGRYLVEAHLREGRSVAELAAAHGVHPSWIYRLLARFRAEGEAGLVARSRRPKTSPNALRAAVEEAIVLLRKQLTEEGLDAGAQTIHWHLERRYGTASTTSVATTSRSSATRLIPIPPGRPARGAPARRRPPHTGTSNSSAR